MRMTAKEIRGEMDEVCILSYLPTHMRFPLASHPTHTHTLSLSKKKTPPPQQQQANSPPQADAHTATLRTAALLRSHAHLLSDCRHVLALVENMVLEHVDTIQTAFTLLDAMEGMSPHVEGVRKEMVGKLEGCERGLEELVGVKGRVEGGG